jgi:hypothetical protein
VIGVPVGDVDRGEPLAEALDPVGERIDLIEGNERVHQDGVVLTVDEGGAHRRPHRIIARSLRRRSTHGPHRRDVDVKVQVGHD